MISATRRAERLAMSVGVWVDLYELPDEVSRREGTGYRNEPRRAGGGGLGSHLEEIGVEVAHLLHTPPHTLHAAPYTLHPSPCTLHPTPYTLHPTTYNQIPRTDSP